MIFDGTIYDFTFIYTIYILKLWVIYNNVILYIIPHIHLHIYTIYAFTFLLWVDARAMCMPEKYYTIKLQPQSHF